MAELINHKELAESRLATEYKQSVKLISYIKALLLEANTLESVFQNLLTERWIDTAKGVNLDILGSIVGQPRDIVAAELFGYFGFAVNLESGPFGSVSDPTLGDKFRAIGQPITGNRELSDEEYRIWIRARIAKNRTSSTPEDIISQLQLIFGTTQILFIDGNTEYNVSIGRLLTGDEKSILLNFDIIPKTAGVRANYVTQYDDSNFFSFSGIPGSNGFGSLSSPALGGKFGKLIF